MTGEQTPNAKNTDNIVKTQQLALTMTGRQDQKILAAGAVAVLQRNCSLKDLMGVLVRLQDIQA